MDYRTKCKIIILVEETIGENLHDWGLGDVEIRASQVALVVKNLPANAGDLRDLGSIPGLGKSPGGGLGIPLKYSCQENPMDRGSWWVTVHGVAKSRTRLSNEHFHYFSKVSCVNSRGKIKTQSHISRGGWLGTKLLSLTCIQNSWRACSNADSSSAGWGQG